MKKGYDKNRKSSVEVGFVLGNIARLLNRKYADFTHYWKVYLKGVNDEDISPLIKSVTFGLHRTCIPSILTLTSPPYETSQKGWGEFVIYVTIDFVDDTEDSVTLEHLLRLYPDNQEKEMTTKIEIQSESVHYIVFENPSPEFNEKIQSLSSVSNGSRRVENFTSEFSKIKNARKNVVSEKIRLMERIKEIQRANVYLRQDIDNIFKLYPIGVDDSKMSEGIYVKRE